MDYGELHRDALVIDSHNDTIVAHILAGNRSLVTGERSARATQFGTIGTLRGRVESGSGPISFQIDLPKMQGGGIDAGFFAIDVTSAFQNRLAYALDGFGYLLDDLQTSSFDAIIVRSVQDIAAAKGRGVPAIILAVEHADCVERSLHVLHALHALGVRSIGLTHNISSLAADGCMEARDGVGLTLFGVRLVQRMNALGMLVDLAHVSPGAFFHALEATSKPVIFSHGNARALCDHPRNLTDEQLAALARNRGVIGMSFVPPFVDAERPTLDRLLDHIEHVAGVAGVETVGIGSDFDGGGTLLADATRYPCLTEGLIDRGFTEPDIRLILGGNTLRVLSETIG